MIGRLFVSFVLTILPQFLSGQNKSHSVLGQGFDIRFVDALHWGSSANGKQLVLGGSSAVINEPSSATSYHFITTPYEFEDKLLQTNAEERPFLAINSGAHYAPLRQDGSDKLLFVYTQKKVPTGKKILEARNASLDSAFVEDFRRLGRDITPAGFLYRYGTHYAQEVILGGLFLQRNSIKVDDFIYSPYKKEEFQEKVIEEISAQQRGAEDTTPFIDASESVSFTVGGKEDEVSPKIWLQTVTTNPKPIDVKLTRLSVLLRAATIFNVDDKVGKLRVLDSIINAAILETQERIKPPQKSPYYKKYSLQFNQEITSIVKKSTGNEDENKTAFTGDIFFGGFSKDEAILKTSPLIDRGGLRLETLITDERVSIDKRILITIKPDDIKTGYVSVWDDTKKLFKGNGRTKLRISGPPEAHTTYQEALRRVVTKQVTIETIDRDVYEVEYKLSLVKPPELIQNFGAAYNYILDSEILAAVSNGNTQKLDSLFARNGNPRAIGLIESIIINKHPNSLLNYVLDKGAIPTTSDLDILFERAHFDATKALILLERGALPKNNMIYKAVAYDAANVIYALFREGATSQNNDLAFAIRKSHYPTIKALMSESYEAFKAGSKELLLAAENNDEKLAQKFVDLNATATAAILNIALEQENEALEEVIVPVTEPTSATLEVVAQKNNTALFSYFVRKNATLEDNTAVEIAVDNNNTEILDLALKNGGNPTQALLYSIKKDNRSAVETSLKNKAEPDAVFAYATTNDDEPLFNDALNLYGGTPAVALDEAVKKDALPMAATVLKTQSENINPSGSVALAVSNENLDMVRLLVDNKANPSEGIQSAIDVESVPITEYLISQGAETAAPTFLQEAVKKNNVALSRVLVEKGNAQANNAIIEAAVAGNLEITQYLLKQGASADKALPSAMETKNEDVILLLMNKAKASLDPSYLLTASRKGNLRVAKRLIETGAVDPTTSIGNAIRYKKPEILELLLEQGGIPNALEFRTALEFNFYSGIEILLDSGFFKSNQAFRNGEYPLHIIGASYEDGDEKILPLLLDNGADINAQNSYGETALHLAARVNEDEITIVQLLLDHNASTQIRNSKKQMPIDYAIYKPIKNLLKKAARNRK